MSVRQVPGELVGVRRQAGEVEHLAAPGDFVGWKTTPAQQHPARVRAAVQVQAQQHVLERGHLLKERGQLEGADEPARGDLVRLEAGDAFAVEDDRATGRPQEAG
jgi:hypothetical protein